MDLSSSNATSGHISGFEMCIVQGNRQDRIATTDGYYTRHEVTG